MREMRWSWAELEATPLYVRQFVFDFILRRRRVENARRQQQADAAEPPGTMRIKR